MKQGLEPYFRLTAALLAGSFLVSFLLSVLYTFSILSASAYGLGCLIAGALLYGACGMIFAMKARKKVFFQALGILAVLAVAAFMLTTPLRWQSFGGWLLKGGCFLAGCLIMLSRR